MSIDRKEATIMFKTATSLFSKIGSIVLIGSIAWLGWQNLGPRKPEPGTARRELADEMMSEIIIDLRENREDVRKAALLHFANDSTDYITGSLRNAIEKSGVFGLRDTTALYKARSMLRLQHPAYDNLNDALERARSLDAESVIFGTVHAFEAFPDGTVVDLEVKLAHTESGEIMLKRRYTRDTSETSIPTAFKTSDEGVHWLSRSMIWLLIVLLLPVFTINFIRAMIRKESNKVNAFTLGIYTIADALLAFLMIGMALSGWFTVFLFIIAVGAAFVYNFQIMNFALKLET